MCFVFVTRFKWLDCLFDAATFFKNFISAVSILPSPALSAGYMLLVCFAQVSWIRSRDLHILTSGTLTYTSDSRFEVLHVPGSEVWTLRIMSAQPRDQGRYECQVNTDPKINFAVSLIVKGQNQLCTSCCLLLAVPCCKDSSNFYAFPEQNA